MKRNKVEFSDNRKNQKSGVIYVLAPAHFKTGGIELLHQLVYELNQSGRRATVVYYNLRMNNNINPQFKKYVNSYITENEIVDSERNILIVPETRVQLLAKFRKIKKVIWWLSVDNYYPTMSFKSHIEKFGVLKTCKHVLLYRDIYRDWELSAVADLHLVQSEYAKQFLKNQGISKVVRLSDYLNDLYFEKRAAEKRKDYVFYNPVKGFEFTKKIIDMSPDINWFALQNMTTQEVRDCLLKGKVYIDFGNHPGKDRFPREAAMLGCCIITGRRGAAENEIDIPIADEFKFADAEENIPLIVAKIRECIKDYDNTVLKFSEYKEIITGEKKVFRDDVQKIFCSD